MENHDLAIIIPGVGKEALYRILSSLTLQSDKRFAVYGFILRGDSEGKALYEDYADHLDLILTEVDAWPDGEQDGFAGRTDFYLSRTGGEKFVTFSDGETLYGRDCVRSFHAEAWRREGMDLFCWRTRKRGARICSFRRFFLSEVLGNPWPVPGGAWVLRRASLQRVLGEIDVFSNAQVLTDLASGGGLVRLEERVGGGKPAGKDLEARLETRQERCSLIEWAEERFPDGQWPVGRMRSLARAADCFSNLTPDIPLGKIRERYMALRMAGSAPLAAKVFFFFSTRGL